MHVQADAPAYSVGAIWHIVMLIVCLIVLIPIVMVVLGSFKTVTEFFSKPYGLPETYDFFNYRKAWDKANIQTTLRNSILVTGLSVLFSTILACLAAYGLARFRFPGGMPLRLLFVGGLVVPVQLIILPIFVILKDLGILGDIRSLIAVYSVFGIPLGVLVLTRLLRPPAQGSGGCRPDRRREPPADLLADHAAARPSGPGRGGDSQRRLDVE